MKKLICFLLLFGVISAKADLIIVDSNEDLVANDNNCTLREALLAANYNLSVDQCQKGLGDDLIWLLITDTNQSIELNNPLPIIEGVTIQGPGIDNLVLHPSSNHNGHIFQINTSDDVKLIDFSIDGAKDSAIDVINVGDMELLRMRLLNNQTTAGFGGAIHADTLYGTTESVNSVVINNSEFSFNQANQGGVIAASGTFPLSIKDSLFFQNTAVLGGGAIYKHNPTTVDVQESLVNINNSQFIGNDGGVGAAALDVYVVNVLIDASLFHQNKDISVLHIRNSLAIITNSMWSDNTVNNVIYHTKLNPEIPSELTVNFNTFIGNQDLAIQTAGSQAITYIRANVFSDNQMISCQEINGGSIQSNGYNVESVGSSCYDINSDMSYTDPQLMALDYYGGDRLIAPPHPMSPLVDAASTNCPDTDLSGEGRPRDGDASGGLGQCDIGAVERPNANALYVLFKGNGSGSVYLSEFDITCQSTASCKWPLPKYETFLVTASPDSGSTFIEWGGPCSGDGACNVDMNNIQFLTAEFVSISNPVTLSVNKITDNSGLSATVVSTPAGIDCGTTCSADYLENDLVELEATPNNKTVIDYWQGCDTVSQDGLRCIVTMGNQNKTIDVYLTKNPDIIFANGFE